MRKILQRVVLAIAYLVSFIIYYSGMLKVIVLIRKKILKKKRAVIFAYHSISEYTIVYAKKREFITCPRQFRKQLLYLTNNFNIVSMQELEGVLQTGRLKEDSAVLTFDDGHRDNFLNALSILTELKLPAIFFLTTGFIGRDNYLTWEQVNIMKEKGFQFGCHTITHPHLTSLSSEMVRGQIMESKLELENKLKQKIRYFSYPYGDYNDSVVNIVKECGFSAAVTTVDSASVLSDTDFFRINRKTVLKRPFSFFALKAEGLFECKIFEGIRRKVF